MMIRVNLADAEAHLSWYVKRAASGERVIVCERNVPVAELRSIPSPEQSSSRRLGFLDGQIGVADDAFASLSEFELNDWYGQG